MSAHPTETASFSLQITLLDNLEKYCTAHDLQKSQVVAKALRRFLAAEMGDSSDFWEELYDNGKITTK